MAKTEDIEAKLAAYVDGDIDAAGRAEIEKHLASHPKHRDLLVDLSRQRDLLRALPRDMAPADVAETINSQLERAVLLGDVDDGMDIAGSIGRFSQLRAVAAVLLLTGGLAGIIYYLLPFSSRHNNELADMRITAPAVVAASPTTSMIAEVAEPNPSVSDTRLLATAPTDEIKAAATEPAIADAGARTQIAMSDNTLPLGVRGGFGGGGGFDRSMASNAISPRQQVFSDVMQSRAAPAPSPEVMQSVYVVSSDNPESTSRDLREYLRNSNIAWEDGAEGMPRPLDAVQQDNILSMRQQQAPTVQLKMGAEAQAALADTQGQQGQASSQRIVAKRITREQAVALHGWLNQLQQSQSKDQPGQQQALTMPPRLGGTLSTTEPSSIAGSLAKQSVVSDNELAPSTAPAMNEAALKPFPFALGSGLNEVLDFSIRRPDAPGVELDNRRADASSKELLNNNTPIPATQQAEARDRLTMLGDFPTTLPSVAAASDRVDVVIVVEAQMPAVPTTLPATTEPSP